MLRSPDTTEITGWKCISLYKGFLLRSIVILECREYIRLTCNFLKIEKCQAQVRIPKSIKDLEWPWISMGILGGGCLKITQMWWSPRIHTDVITSSPQIPSYKVTINFDPSHEMILTEINRLIDIKSSLECFELPRTSCLLDTRYLLIN